MPTSSKGGRGLVVCLFVCCVVVLSFVHHSQVCQKRRRRMHWGKKSFFQSFSIEGEFST